MPESEVTKQRDAVIEQIVEYCPTLGNFFRHQETLREYSERIQHLGGSAVYAERQRSLQKKITEKCRELFGEERSQQLNLHYAKHLAVNIVDHHQFLNHPLLISNNIVANIGKFLQPAKPPAIVVFPSGDVPPNNYFSKNGFQLHGKKVSLFSNAEKESSTYYLPKRKFDFVDRLQAQKRWGEFDAAEQKFLNWYQGLIFSIDHSSCVGYLDQVSLVVNKTWPLMFEESLRSNLPELVYISQEEITSRALVDLLQQENFITQALFDEKFRKIVLDAFRGIVVTWREEEGKGTHFFWRKHPSQPRALRMFIEGNTLVPHDRRYRHLAVPLTRDSIVSLLREKQIYPSLFMIFAVNNFYYGVKPLLGHGSMIYLNLIRAAWLKVLPQSDFRGEADHIESVLFDTLVSGLTLFIKKHDQRYQEMYAHDVMFDGGAKKEELEKMFGLKYSDLLAISVPGIYDYVSQKYVPDDKKIKLTCNFNELAQLVFK